MYLAARLACGTVEIVDPTTQVVHGSMTFCCANCSAAMEESGSGSDPDTRSHADDPSCAHCGARIVDDTTMAEREGRIFCCDNCARATVASAGARH